MSSTNKQTRRGRLVTPLPRKKHSCIVIGGGLAGLAAGYRLSQRGWHVTVLEAHRRLGGRVYSYHFRQAPKLVCELGGEWIGDDHCAMKRLAGGFGLELLPHRYSYFFWDVNSRTRRFRPGEDCFKTKAQTGFGNFTKAFKKYRKSEKRHLDRLDWWTCLREMGFSDKELLQRDLMDSTDFGESIRQASAYTAASEYVNGNATDEMDWKIAGGNSRLVQALAHSIGGTGVRKRAEVTAIRQRGERVTVSLADGEKITGDVCICAIPARCLGRIHWDPPLDDDQIAAADQLQYSRIMKTAVLYRKRFWPEHKDGGFSVFTSRVSDFCFDSTYLQEQKGGILCSYAIGEKADDLAAEPNEKDVADWLTQDICQAIGLPKKAAKKRGVRPVDIQRQPWQDQHWIGGAYAFYRPGQWFTVRPILQRPHDRVFFAGEHLAEWQGFMEGAVNTGEAAADSL